MRSSYYIAVSYTHLDVYKRQDKHLTNQLVSLVLTLKSWFLHIYVVSQAEGLKFTLNNLNV